MSTKQCILTEILGEKKNLFVKCFQEISTGEGHKKGLEVVYVNYKKTLWT